MARAIETNPFDLGFYCLILAYSDDRPVNDTKPRTTIMI